jgi:hypothetical protein
MPFTVALNLQGSLGREWWSIRCADRSRTNLRLSHASG